MEVTQSIVAAVKTTVPVSISASSMSEPALNSKLDQPVVTLVAFSGGNSPGALADQMAGPGHSLLPAAQTGASRSDRLRASKILYVIAPVVAVLAGGISCR